MNYIQVHFYPNSAITFWSVTLSIPLISQMKLWTQKNLHYFSLQQKIGRMGKVS